MKRFLVVFSNASVIHESSNPKATVKDVIKEVKDKFPDESEYYVRDIVDS